MSGIQNQADKHIFSSVPKCQASLKYKVVRDILEIVCHIFAIFLHVCLSQVLFNEVKEPKKLIVMSFTHDQYQEQLPQKDI